MALSTSSQPLPGPTRALLIFNPTSGLPGESPIQLLEIINAIQAQNLQPEVHLVQPESNLVAIVQDALRRHVRLFVVSGGDGTIDSVASALAGTSATLAIVPTGTQNNVALSLGIPTDITSAISLLRSGQRIQVDMGLATCETARRPFLEACSVGLLSALFPAADEIQHGRLAAIGDFLGTLVSAPLAQLRLIIENRQVIETEGHVVLIGNMPFIGPHYAIGARDAFNDGLLDVLLFANLSKLDLIGTAMQMVSGAFEDPRIQRYQVRKLQVHTNPPMPILVDGFLLGQGPLQISVQRRALWMIVPQAAVNEVLAVETTPEPLNTPGDPV